MPRRWPQPSELRAEEYRRAAREWDNEPIGHIERAGFGYRDGYRGAYAERPTYMQPRGRLRRPAPEGSGWPRPVFELDQEAEARHLRALADRDLARAVDFALYNTIGREADAVAVYAADGVITLEGRLSHSEAVECALETAWETPGVRRVRNALQAPEYDSDYR